MIRIIESIFALPSYVYEALNYPNFSKIRAEAQGGKLKLIYRNIYDVIYRLPDLDVIEVGSGAGASSIVIASAMRRARKKSRLITVEKCEGGSRAAIGDYQANLAFIRNNFKKFRVADKIALFPKELTYENGNEVISLIKTPGIAALILDADAGIDRDFFLFWPLLMPEASIIIDDYGNLSEYLPISDIYNRIQKKVTTYRLLNQFIDWGLFKINYKVNDTVFGYKPANSDFSKFDRSVCKNIIQEVEAETSRYAQDSQKRLDLGKSYLKSLQDLKLIKKK